MSKLYETRLMAQSNAELGKKSLSKAAFLRVVAQTDAFYNKAQTNKIYDEEKLRHNTDVDAVRNKSKIEYDKINMARGNQLSKYSFKVRTGYEYDESTGEYSKDENGQKRAAYITVRSNRKLSKSQILKAAKRIRRRSMNRVEGDGEQILQQTNSRKVKGKYVILSATRRR